MVVTRKRKKQEVEQIFNANNQLEPTNEQMARKRPAFRRVEFNGNPTIYEITPLDEKQTGVIRMPEASKSLQKDMESPEDEVDNESRNDEFNVSPRMDTDTNDKTVTVQQHEIEIEILTPDRKPPKLSNDGIYSTKAKSNAYSDDKFNALPKMDLSDITMKESLPDHITSISFIDISTTNKLKELPHYCQYLSSEEHHAFNRGKLKKSAAVGSQSDMLWSRLFEPRTAEDFIGKSRLDFQELNNWLDQWKKRLSWIKKSEIQKQQKKKKKRRRSSGFESEEESDPEYLPEYFAEAINNPFVLEGPTGCGKTAMVYAVAKANGFHVLEISTSTLRDGQTLKQKFAGALKCHNVNIRKQPDIRAIFLTPDLKRNRNRDPNEDFSLILIDECDNIFESDHNFWQVLKTFCLDSRIPIVLTCNDYVSVGNALNSGKLTLEYKTIHMQRPGIQCFAYHLRAWLFGFTGCYHKIGRLYHLIDAKNQDPRAVLNALQLEFCQQLNRYEKADSDKRMAISLKEQKKCAVGLAELDAAWQLGERISPQAKIWTNLNFVDGTQLINNHILNFVDGTHLINGHTLIHTQKFTQQHKAALQALNDVGDLFGDGSKGSVIHVLSDEIQQCSDVLCNMV